MPWIDHFIIILLVLGVMYGVLRPTMQGLISLALLLTGLFLAVHYCDLPAQSMGMRMTGGPLGGCSLGFAAIFLGSLLFIIVMHLLVRPLFKDSKTPLQRLAGLCVGFLEAAVIVCAILVWIVTFWSGGNSFVEKSRIGSRFQPVITRLGDYFPSALDGPTLKLRIVEEWQKGRDRMAEIIHHEMENQSK